MMNANTVSVGYRFVPTDLELLNHYLLMKINKKPLPCNVVRETNVYASSPDEIADQYKPVSGEKMYFFSPRERRYTKGNRPNRTAGYGYWKASVTKQIYDDGNVHVGSRMMLEYMKGEHGNAKKSKWIMQEYTIEHSSPHQANEDEWDDLVLCAIYETPRKSKKNHDSYQDTRVSQLTGIKRISSEEPSLFESPDARSSKMRRVSSDQSLPCYPNQPHGNLASSSMAPVVQTTSSAVSDHVISVGSQDHGLQQFQSSMPHQEIQISSSQQQQSYPSTSTVTEAGFDDFFDWDEMFGQLEESDNSKKNDDSNQDTINSQLNATSVHGISVTSEDYGFQQFQSSVPQEMQILTSDQQQSSYPIISTEVGFEDSFDLDDNMLAGLKELDILLST